MQKQSASTRDPAAPPLVALIHGSAGGPEQWQPHVQRLQRAWRIATPALLGYSGTAEQPADARVTLRNEALHLAHQLQDAPGAMHLVAHGYGAAVALHFALLHPAHVGSLTLYEPTLFHVLRDGVDTPAEIAVGTALQHAVQRRYESGDLAGAAWVFHDYWSGEGAWQALTSEVRAAIAARMPKVAAELHAVMTEATPLRGYAELTMPVLLMQGERTRRTPRRIVQRLAEALPRAAVLDVTGADHLGAVTQPRVMCQLVDAFLWSRHASGDARRYGAVTSRHARAIDSIHTAPTLPGIGGSQHH